MDVKNYKEETYFPSDEGLIVKLNVLCEELSFNMKTPNKSFLVTDILKHKIRAFQNC
jgi:hypothetical protein